MKPFHVTVFGGAQVKPGDAAYAEAFTLGSLLGQQGWTVLTGGYIGTMEAASRGASEAGSHVIGVTCEDIELWRKIKPNQWVAEERRFPNLRQRMMALIDLCDAAVALPGGVGTLAEIMMTWNQLLIQTITPRPLILIGPGWKALVDTLYGQLGQYITPEQRAWVQFAADPAQAVSMLQEFTAGGKV